MESGSAEYLSMYITIIYTVVAMILGALVAVARKDYATRGAAVSCFAGLFGPLFMWMSPPSRAREGEKDIWPLRGPEAVVLNVVAVALFNNMV